MQSASRVWNDISLKLLHNPHDLNSWQELVYTAETHSGVIDKCSDPSLIETLRATYEAFLAKYPHFMAYWVSYALWESKLGNHTNCKKIFGRGLQYGDGDLNYWLALIKYEVEVFTDDCETILKIFEQARYRIGLNYHSHDFYALYFSFLKTYASAENDFEKKVLSLARILIEIPLYNYAASYKDISDTIFSSMTNSRRAANELGFLSDRGSTALPKSDKRELRQSLERSLKDFYVFNQFRSTQIFEFEQKLSDGLIEPSATLPSANLVESWIAYLVFAEQNFSTLYTSQLYERCLIATCGCGSILAKYSDYLQSRKSFVSNRNVLRKFIPLVPAQEKVNILLRLIDSEIYMGNMLSARDHVCNYIMINRNIPLSIYQKLISLEAMFHPNDTTYLLSLVKNMVTMTKSAHFFHQASVLGLNDDSLLEFFQSFIVGSNQVHESRLLTVELKQEEIFWTCLDDIRRRIENR